MSDQIKIRTTVQIVAQIEFDEGQLKALEAMACYGIDAFLKVFYEKLGTVYMKPHEANLRTLFACIKDKVPMALCKVREARKVLGITENMTTRLK